MEEEKKNRIKWLHVRLTEDEYKDIVTACKGTTNRKLSDYVRKVILGKPHIGIYRNASLDEFMGEMVKLRKDLNGVANNFNQVVHKLHILDRFEQLKNWFITYDLEKKILFNRIDEIKGHISKFGASWLQ